MSDITTQGLVEQINSVTVEQAGKNLELSNLKYDLENTKIALRIKELEGELRELKKQDKELREQGKNILIESGVKKFEALDGTIIQLNKKPGALIIEDEANIDEYKKEKVTITIDKKAIKEDLKEGVIIDGVYIKEDYNLVIKNNI